MFFPSQPSQTTHSLTNPRMRRYTMRSHVCLRPGCSQVCIMKHLMPGASPRLRQALHECKPTPLFIVVLLMASQSTKSQFFFFFLQVRFLTYINVAVQEYYTTVKKHKFIF